MKHIEIEIEGFFKYSYTFEEFKDLILLTKYITLDKFEKEVFKTLSNKEKIFFKEQVNSIIKIVTEWYKEAIDFKSYFITGRHYSVSPETDVFEVFPFHYEELIEQEIREQLNYIEEIFN